MSDPAWPGESIGLPQTGRGSLASWGARIAALVADWAASMIVAVVLFGTRVLTGHGWPAWMILAVFFVESTLLTITTGASFGQLLARVGVARLDGRPLAWWQAVVRCGLKCLVLPAVIIGAERRSITDIILGTVVVNRR